MSQAKVDQYKEFKKNRKENLEKEKKAQRRRAGLWKLIGLVLALAVVVALGITVYNAVIKRINAAPDYAREQLVIGDVAGIFTTTVAEEATTPAADDTTAAEESTVDDVETTPAPAETTAASQ